MSSSTTTLLPVTQKERIFSLDILRGFVLLGILLMNIAGFGLARGSYGDPTVAGGAQGWNLTAWITTTLFFEGTMRALFSLLFGVGMLVLTSRLEKQGAGIQAAEIYFRRTLWLIFFGLVHAYLLLWGGEILFTYGVMGLLIFSFRHMAPKKLVLIALFLIVCGNVWEYANHQANIKMVEKAAIAKQYQAAGKVLTKDLKEAQTKWEEIQYKHSAAFIKDYNTKMRQSYLNLVTFLAPQNLANDKTEPYRYGLWDIMSMMLLGIALFRWQVLTAERPYKFYALMAAAGYAIGLSINYYELQLILNSKFSFLGFSQTNLTYYWGRLFMAMGHVGLIMIFCKLPVLYWLKNALAAVGRMALTNYLIDSLICMIVFTGVGFGMFGKLQRYELYFVVLSIWAFQLIASPIWLRYFRFGPAEWLWRSLTYWQLQPMRKANIENLPPEKAILASTA